jgi:hypothetical protein
MCRFCNYVLAVRLVFMARIMIEKEFREIAESSFLETGTDLALTSSD